MAVCKRCGCAIPIGQKTCDICDRTGGSANAQQAQSWQSPQPWQAPAQAMPATELASSGAVWVTRAEAVAPGAPISAEAAPKGGFWMRVLAYLIDDIIIGLPAYALGVVILHGGLPTASSISFLLEIVYFTYYWSAYGKGQTMGMQVLHLKVVRTDGSMLGLSRAFIRFVGLIAAAIPFDIGLLWVAFDSRKQGWHDKIAGTYVISNW